MERDENGFVICFKNTLNTRSTVTESCVNDEDTSMILVNSEIYPSFSMLPVNQIFILDIDHNLFG